MYQLTNLDLLTRYGPEFLTRDEFEEHLQEKFSEYYRVMARRFIENRENEYWQYHRQELQKLGYQFSFLKVLLETLHEFVVYPRWVVRTIYKLTKRKIKRVVLSANI